MPSAENHPDRLQPATEQDMDRLNDVWQSLAGIGNYDFSPANRMELWALEHKVRTERLTTERLTRATWALVLATVVLAVASIALVVVTVGL
jgi:hypothetical protein